MDASDYVARRMLCEIREIVTPINDRFESLYDGLYDWMKRYTEEFGDAICYRLPTRKATGE